MGIPCVLNPAHGPQVGPGLCALGVMTKAPRPGKVKTRLIPPLTPEEAAALNTCFLRDITKSIQSACSTRNAKGVAVYTPVGEESAYEGILPSCFSLVAQRGIAFGERLIFAAEDLLKIGFESICLINSDSPTVPARTFSEAAQVLSRPGDRVVLGPSEDGGYYLIGLKKLHARLFQEIDWSTERVLAQTMERVAELNLEVHLLPTGFDVDDEMTLHRLCDDLLAHPAAESPAINTRRYLFDLVAHDGRGQIWMSL